MTVGFPFPSFRSAQQYGPQLATPSFLSQLPSGLGSRPPLGQLSPAGNSLPSLPLFFPLGSPIGAPMGAGSLFPVGNPIGLPNILANLFPHNPQHFGSSLPISGFRSVMPFPMDGLSSTKPALFPPELTSGGNALPGMGLPRPLTNLFPLMQSPFVNATLLPQTVGQAEFRQTPQPVTQTPQPQPVTQTPVAPPQPVTQTPQPQPVTQTPVVPPPPVTQTPQPQPKLTSGQLDNLNFLRQIAEKGMSTPAETAKINKIFLDTPLDAKTMTEAKELGESMAALLFSDPALVTTVNDWPNLTTAKRQQFISDFVEKASEHLGFDVDVKLYNTPAVNGQFAGGFYDPATNSVNVNTIPEAMDNASTILQILVHELGHASKSHEIGRVSKNIVDRAINGEISYTNTLIAFANLPGIYKTPPEVDLNTYQHNMHEQFAFTTQHFFDEAARPHGLTPQRETFTADHPLYKNLVAAGVA